MSAQPMLSFGWTPDPSYLTTVAGCDAMRAGLRQVRMALNNQMQKRSESEREPYIDEMRRLAALESEIKQTRARLDNATDTNKDQFNLAFRRCVSDRFGDAVFRELCAEANARIEQLNGIPSTAAHGPVLEPRSTGGGMKVRK